MICVESYDLLTAKATAERKEREAREKEEKALKAKEEAERLAAEKKKKKPVRYPTEDLDVVLGDRDKKNGMKLRRPTLSRYSMPFGTDHATNENFLMVWNFVNVYGYVYIARPYFIRHSWKPRLPLHISPFTMDEFEGALRYTLPEPPCPLMAEIHSALIYNLRTVPCSRFSLLQSLAELEEAVGPDDEVLGVSLHDLNEIVGGVGNNWERAPLRPSSTRDGWEESLIGCLKDVGDFHTLHCSTAHFF